MESDKLDIVKRVDLEPGNPNELLKNLRQIRWNTEVITVKCRKKSVARQAGRDRRVDLVSYPFTRNWKQNYLDRQQAGLMRDSGCGYLIDLSELITDDPYYLRKNIEYLKRNKDNAEKKDLPVVASSCACTVWGMRDPQGLASLLSLLDVDQDHALDMISNTPNGLVARNREKLKDEYIQPNVWVIEE